MHPVAKGVETKQYILILRSDRAQTRRIGSLQSTRSKIKYKFGDSQIKKGIKRLVTAGAAIVLY